MVWYRWTSVKENNKSWKKDKGGLEEGLQFWIGGPGKVSLWTGAGRVPEVERRARAKAQRWALTCYFEE